VPKLPATSVLLFNDLEPPFYLNFNRLRRSSSQDLDNEGLEDFKRSGFRATAGARLGWSRDIKYTYVDYNQGLLVLTDKIPVAILILTRYCNHVINSYNHEIENIVTEHVL